MATIIIGTPNRGSSIGNYFFVLAEELARRRHQVVILVGGQRCDLIDTASNPSVLTWPSPRPTRIRDASFLLRLIKSRRPTCVIGNFGAVNLLLLVGKLAGVPHRVAWYHTLSSQIDRDSEACFITRAILRRRKSLVYKFATAIFANSVASAIDIQQCHGVPAQRCDVLPYLIPDPAEMVSPSVRDRRRVICVGRLHPSKGQDVVIQAVATVRSAVPDVTVEFVGSGPTENGLKELAEKSGISDRCIFRGSLPLSDTLQHVASAGVSVVPSLAEAFGLVTVEAQGLGNPVIASNVGGIRDIVRDGETGFLVPPSDPDAVAQCLIRLLTNDEFRDRMGAAARSHFLNTYSAESNIAAHAERIEEIMR